MLSSKDCFSLRLGLIYVIETSHECPFVYHKNLSLVARCDLLCYVVIKQF